MTSCNGDAVTSRSPVLDPRKNETLDIVTSKKKIFKIFGVMVPNTKHVVLTKKDKVNIVNRLKKAESGKKLAEEHGVGTFNSLGHLKKKNK